MWQEPPEYPWELRALGTGASLSHPELPLAFLLFGLGRMQSLELGLSGIKSQRKAPSNPTEKSLQPPVPT